MLERIEHNNFDDGWENCQSREGSFILIEMELLFQNLSTLQKID